MDIDNVSLETVPACILVSTTCSADNDVGVEIVFYGTYTSCKPCPDTNDRSVTGNTMAHLLTLYKEDDSPDSKTRKAEGMYGGSLYMIDTWATAGNNLPRHLLSTGTCPQLPVNEEIFNPLIPGDPSRNWKPEL